MKMLDDPAITETVEIESENVLQTSLPEGVVNYAALVVAGLIILAGLVLTLICCCRKKHESKNVIDD